MWGAWAKQVLGMLGHRPPGEPYFTPRVRPAFLHAPSLGPELVAWLIQLREILGQESAGVDFSALQVSLQMPLLDAFSGIQSETLIS